MATLALAAALLLPFGLAAPAAREVVHVPGWPSSGSLPLSFATKVGGVIYASGLAGLDMGTGKLVAGGVAAETTRALQNLAEVMSAAGGSLSGIAGCNVLLSNMSADFVAMNGAYAAFWQQEPPSRVAVQVGALQGNASVEIQCTGVLPGYERAVVHLPGVPGMKGFPLSFGVRAAGMVYASGMQGMDFETKKLVEGGAAPETRQTLVNIDAILKAAGSGLDRVVSCEVSLRNMSDFQAVNKEYSSFWPRAGFPSRVAVQVADLAGHANVEIRCLAASHETPMKVVVVPSWPAMKGFPLSAGIAAGGVVYASGMQGMDMKVGKLVPGGVAEETRQALQNVEAVFGAAGARLADALLCEVTLKDMKDVAAMNGAYQRFWPKDPPARFAIQAAGLAGSAKVEIRCVGALSEPPELESELLI